jgi:energy-converting hydrogenase B subunit D
MNTSPGAVDFLVGAALVLVVVAATCAALTRDPVRQSVLLSVLGVCLALLFLAVQAPDVALSQLAVGTAVTPLLILLTVRKIRRGPGDRDPSRKPAQEPGQDPGRRDGDGDDG